MSARPSVWRRLVDDVRRGRLPGHYRLRQQRWLLAARLRAAFGPQQPRAAREIHAVVVWSRALPRYDDIMRDVRQNFVVRDVFEVDWSTPDFSRNMTRFYGGLLPANAEKEKHCGTDPFIVVVVEDRDPEYAPRPTPRGSVNTRMFDAKQRYREWTGGGHRIHASVDVAEAEHDLFLLLGRRTNDYLVSSAPWDGVVRKVGGGLQGAAGWRDLEELLAAISVATPHRRLGEAAGPSGVVLAVDDRVRAALTADSRPQSGELDSELHEVTVAGEPMQLRLVRDIRRGVRRQPRTRAAVGAILLYHRIDVPRFDPFKLSVDPDRFEQHLTLLSARFPLVGLGELLGRLDRGEPDAPAVVVTFDDGYADNLHTAYPIAHALGTPLTVFVTGLAIRDGGTFWWDELTALLTSDAGAGPRELKLEIGGRRRRFRLGSQRARARTSLELHRLLRPLDERARRALLHDIAAQLGELGPDLSARALTSDELKELAAQPAVAIGGHTMRHVALSSLPPEEQLCELRESKQFLETVTGCRVDYFSYPFGRPADVGDVSSLVAEAGYHAACTTVQAAVTMSDSRYALPRLTVHDEAASSLVERVTALLSP